jgi:DNA-binding LacI/PurR family transcriptional regulator
MITEHLIRKGKKEFLYIAGPESSYVAKCRFKGFSEAIEKAGLRLKKENFFMGMFNMDKAKNYVKERFSQGKNGIDAVICANDNMAIGAIGSLLELNISIPDEVSVAGADNIKLGKYIYPSLTTFNYHPYHLGENAFKLLYNIINGSSPGDNILLETSLQARMSA